jgi:endoglucanase
MMLPAFRPWRALALAALALGAWASEARAAADAVGVVDGRTLVKSCRPWAPRGLSFFGRLVPADWTVGPDTAAARAGFGRWTVDAVKAVGGDTMRLQVGTPFLDPQSPAYRPAYLDEVRDAVRMARSAGLTVILSMQWEQRVRVEPVEKTPQGGALRAWGRLGPAFADDDGIVFELFNEPASKPWPGADEWEAWRAGHQAIIDELRRREVRNTLIVEGANWGKVLEGAPPLRDPLGRLAYGVHPYFAGDMATPPMWDRHWGAFAQSHPVVVTEWSHFANMCKLTDAATVDAFVDYLAARHIGLVAYGADEQNGRLMDVERGRITLKGFRGHACNDAGAGPGEAVQRLFARLAEADARAAPLARCTAK